MMLFMASFGAKGVILFQDNFPYPQGPIGLESGGNAGGGGGIWVSGAGSTYGTTLDISATGINSLEIFGTSPGDLPRTYFTNGIVGLSYPQAPLFTNTVYYFSSNAPVAALYASFNLEVDPGAFATNHFGSSASYFAYFTDTNFDFSPRIFMTTNTATNSGAYRVSIVNATSIYPMDLFPGSTYQVVVRFVLSTGSSTIWVNPANETSTSVTSSTLAFTDGPTAADAGGVITTNDTSTSGFGVRNFNSGGPTFISSLYVGTTFADVVSTSDGSNPAFLQTGPQNTTNFAGQPATLSVVAGGDADTMGYQWSVGGNPISGATSSSYSIASLVATNQGSYSVFVTNVANPTGFSASAFLAVLPTDIVPTIVTQPSNTVATAGGAATLTVTATDSGAPLAYQWYLGSTALASQTNSALLITSVVFSNAATYKVTVTNPNGDLVTSSNAVLTVNPPAPVICNIQYIRSLLDNTNFTTNASFYANGGLKLFQVTGTNTTWDNFTTSGNSEFFIQDSTGGIAIFWSGAAAASHMPPAGAVVTVVAPISEFDGLLELEPVFTNVFHSVTTNSTNGILPTPLALPFDPFVLTNGNLMQKHMIGEYFGATNVILDQSDGPTFTSSANDPLTNGVPGSQIITLPIYNASTTNSGTRTNVTATNMNGQTITIFYNSHSDIPGAAKPVGPVTVYGVMSIFSSGTPYTSGYEFTPTRLADIVPAISITNVISNVIRQGDQNPNSFATTVLQPGETVTMTVNAQDPGAGTVNLTGLSGNGVWSPITGNGTTHATVTYTYTATTGAEGTADYPTLTASFSSSGYSATYSNLNVIYVPTTNEQNMRITEVFANPTSNTNAPAFDPLLRPLPETGNPSVNDEYIEIVNFNNTSNNINRWSIYSGLGEVFNFINGEAPNAGMATVLYGGPSGSDSNAPSLTTSSMQYREDVGSGLNLNFNGGTVAMYNLAGYLIDRVAYPASGTAITNPATFNQNGQTPKTFPPICSFSRFPTMNSPLVPQPYISTNYVTPGAQYDGGPWTSPTDIPPWVGPIAIGASNNTVTLNFTASTSNATTLWIGNSLLQPFSVLGGGVFSNSAGSFIISNTPPTNQYYFITTP
jgi:hypothetical protein